MKQLLPFKVGYETYALPLIEVQEVVENQIVHPFPGAPAIIAGAIAFHGRIVPVVNLSLLLDFPVGKIGPRLIVLINKRGPVALGVDQVRTVINLEINQTNQMQNRIERNYIDDVINWDGEMISLFALDQLQNELQSLCEQRGN
ncbi:Chemotaxis signal transduction protein [Desulfuromusa kysingii]|uniref:Chemotaxis signal transduction protein n=1 Tax=Desulfuromusa kysingii TaxID=37625 RepID=A0A1H4AQS2_9BACT|nr:chemotaxis protein CheW [Desulfuromusa kysingii]SEA38191.1 Chemotaxis signal transduction protein [Desulfuromusa kysingii]